MEKRMGKKDEGVVEKEGRVGNKRTCACRQQVQKNGENTYLSQHNKTNKSRSQTT